jgi:C_GCAxxG_C_C family probable redox protein
MGMDYQTAIKVSSGFGGGMYLGSVCGAVTGGIMAIGLKYGGADDAVVKKRVLEFANRFKAQHRFINCPELTGVDVSNPEIVKKLSADLSKPENLKAATEALGGRDIKQLFAACGGYVKDAATIVNELVSAPA